MQIVRELHLTTPLDPYFGLKRLAEYSGISVRALRRHLEDPHDPLPFFRAGATILVRRSEFDGWMERRRGHKDTLLDRALEAMHKASSATMPRPRTPRATAPRTETPELAPTSTP
jgi:hypothetical protein